MSGGSKRKQQKHQNKTAFKITFDAQAIEMQKKVSLNNLCLRCTEQMQWKLQYNKYKKATEPGKCNICNQKNVYRSYMKACQPCIQAKKICAKCLQPDYQQPEQVKISQRLQKKQQKQQYNKQIQFMKTLQQRSRRTVRRQLQKGKISWDQNQEYFVDQEGKKMIGLHFRKGFRLDGDNQDDQDFDEDADFGDEDLDDLQENSQEEPEEQQKDNHTKINEKNKQTKKVNSNEIKSKIKQENEAEDNSDYQGDQVDCEGQFQDDDEQLDGDSEKCEEQTQQNNEAGDGFQDIDEDDSQDEKKTQKKSKEPTKVHSKRIKSKN